MADPTPLPSDDDVEIVTIIEEDGQESPPWMPPPTK